MNTISFRLKSELKFQPVEIASTFILAGELRQLICEKLRLDQAKETVQLWDVSDSTSNVEYTDEKQIPRGSKIKVARVPINQRANVDNASELASEPVKAEQPATESAPAEPEPEDEFGGNVFDELEQIRQHNQEAAKRWQAELSAGQRQARFRMGGYMGKSEPQAPAGPCTLCGFKSGRHRYDCPNFKDGERKRQPAQPKGIPTSFMVIRAAPADDEGQPQAGQVKFIDGSLQREEQREEDQKQEAERIANALPTLAPLPAMRLDDDDHLSIVPHQLAPSADTPPQSALTPPSTSEAIALPPILEASGKDDANQPASNAIVVREESPRPRQSLLATDLSLYNACRSFLPKASAEQLFSVFALPAPLSRSEWEDFVRREYAALERRRSPSPSRSRHRSGRLSPYASRHSPSLRSSRRPGSVGRGSYYQRSRSRERSPSVHPTASTPGRAARARAYHARRSNSPSSPRIRRRARSPAAAVDRDLDGRKRSLSPARGGSRSRERSRERSRRQRHDHDRYAGSGARGAPDASPEASLDRYEASSDHEARRSRGASAAPSGGGHSDASGDEDRHRRRRDRREKRGKKDKREKRPKKERRDARRSDSLDDNSKRRRIDHPEGGNDSNGNTDRRRPRGNLVKQAFNAIGVK